MTKREKIENDIKLFLGDSFRSATIFNAGTNRFEASVQYLDGQKPSDVRTQLEVLIPELTITELDRQFSVQAKAAIFDKMYYETETDDVRMEDDSELWEFIDRVSDEMDFSKQG